MPLNPKEKRQLARQVLLAALIALSLFVVTFYYLRIQTLSAQRAKERLLEATTTAASTAAIFTPDTFPSGLFSSFFGGQGELFIITRENTILATSGEIPPGESLLPLLLPDGKIETFTLPQEISAGNSGVLRCRYQSRAVYLAYYPVAGDSGLYAVGILPVSAARAEGEGTVRISFFTLLLLLLLLGGIVVRLLLSRERRHRLIMRQALSGTLSDVQGFPQEGGAPSLLENELHQSLEENRLLASYEPIIRLQNGQVFSALCEALWNHPTRGLLPARDFLPKITDPALQIRCDVALIRAVCQDHLRMTMHSITPLPVLLPLPARLFSDPHFPTMLASLVREYGLEPKSFIASLHGPQFCSVDDLAVVIGSLREAGFRISLTEGGLGFPLFYLLKSVPVDFVSVDFSDINDLLQNTATQRALSMLLSFTDEFGCSLMISGVRFLAQNNLLKELGCDYAGGECFSRPLQAGEYALWVQNGWWQPSEHQSVDMESVYLPQSTLSPPIAASEQPLESLSLELPPEATEPVSKEQAIESEAAIAPREEEEETATSKAASAPREEEEETATSKAAETFVEESPKIQQDPPSQTPSPEQTDETLERSGQADAAPQPPTPSAENPDPTSKAPAEEPLPPIFFSGELSRTISINWRQSGASSSGGMPSSIHSKKQ